MQYCTCECPSATGDTRPIGGTVTVTTFVCDDCGLVTSETVEHLTYLTVTPFRRSTAPAFWSEAFDDQRWWSDSGDNVLV